MGRILRGGEGVSMKPYYDDGKIKIYNADCREILSGLEFDCLITDPPYGFGAYKEDVVFDFSVLKRDKACVFGYPETLLDWCFFLGKPDNYLTWWPTNGALRGAFHSKKIQRETEIIYIWGEINGELLSSKQTESIDPGKFGCLPTRKTCDVLRDPSPGLGFNSKHRRHPNEKPLSLMVKILMLLGWDYILDPFCGSGTTLKAAKELGRRAIGIEKNEAHCEIAARRLSQRTLSL